MKGTLSSFVMITLMFSQVALADPAITSTLESSIVTKVAEAIKPASAANDLTLHEPLQVRQWQWPGAPATLPAAMPAPVWTPPAQQSWAAVPPVWSPSPPAWTPSPPAWAPSPPAWAPSPPAWTPSPQAPQQTFYVPGVPTPTNRVASSPTSTTLLTPSYTWEETHDDSKNTLTNAVICAIVFGAFGAVGFIGVAIFFVKKFLLKSKGVKDDSSDVEMQHGANVPLTQPQNAYLRGQVGSLRRFGL